MAARTSAGNLISDKMAMGVARTLMRALGANKKNATQTTLRIPKTQEQRIAVLKRFRHDEGDRYIGMISRKKATEALCARFAPMSYDFPGDDPDEIPDTAMLMMSISTIDLSIKGIRRNGKISMKDTYAIGAIQGHVIARMAQRAGIKDHISLSKELSKTGGWMSLAILQQDPSPFYVPVESGLFCITMAPMTKRTKEGEAVDTFLIPKVATFIGNDELSSRNRKIREEILAIGDIEDLFPFPAYRIPDDALPVIERSREFGREWLERTGRDLPEVPDLDGADVPSP